MFPFLVLHFVLVYPVVFLTEIVEVFIYRVLLVVEYGEFSHRVQGHGGAIAALRPLVDVPAPFVVAYCRKQQHG